MNGMRQPGRATHVSLCAPVAKLDGAGATDPAYVSGRLDRGRPAFPGVQAREEGDHVQLRQGVAEDDVATAGGIDDREKPNGEGSGRTNSLTSWLVNRRRRTQSEMGGGWRFRDGRGRDAQR